jgi:hypothetical protein
MAVSPTVSLNMADSIINMYEALNELKVSNPNFKNVSAPSVITAVEIFTGTSRTELTKFVLNQLDASTQAKYSGLLKAAENLDKQTTNKEKAEEEFARAVNTGSKIQMAIAGIKLGISNVLLKTALNHFNNTILEKKLPITAFITSPIKGFTISAADLLKNQSKYGVATLRLLVASSMTADDRAELLNMIENINSRNPKSDILAHISVADLYRAMAKGGDIADVEKAALKAPLISELSSRKFVTVNIPKVGPVTAQVNGAAAYNIITGKSPVGMVLNLGVSITGVALLSTGFAIPAVIITGTKALTSAIAETVSFRSAGNGLRDSTAVFARQFVRGAISTGLHSLPIFAGYSTMTLAPAIGYGLMSATASSMKQSKGEITRWNWVNKVIDTLFVTGPSMPKTITPTNVETNMTEETLAPTMESQIEVISANPPASLLQQPRH